MWDSDSGSDMHLDDDDDDHEEDDEEEVGGSEDDSSQTAPTVADSHENLDSNSDNPEEADSDQSEDTGSESDSDNDGDVSELGQALHDNFISDSTMVYNSTAPDSPINLQRQYQPSHSSCECLDDNGYAWSSLDNDDNGIRVSKLQWKRWEKWAVKRCELHDERQQ